MLRGTDEGAQADAQGDGDEDVGDAQQEHHAEGSAEIHAKRGPEQGEDERDLSVSQQETEEEIGEKDPRPADRRDDHPVPDPLLFPLQNAADGVGDGVDGVKQCHAEDGLGLRIIAEASFGAEGGDRQHQGRLLQIFRHLFFHFLRRLIQLFGSAF